MILHIEWVDSVSSWVVFSDDRSTGAKLGPLASLAVDAIADGTYPTSEALSALQLEHPTARLFEPGGESVHEFTYGW